MLLAVAKNVNVCKMADVHYKSMNIGGYNEKITEMTHPTRKSEKVIQFGEGNFMRGFLTGSYSR